MIRSRERIVVQDRVPFEKHVITRTEVIGSISVILCTRTKIQRTMDCNKIMNN